MSRYTGPRLKIARRLGQYLPGLSRKRTKTRTSPPGQHGPTRRPKISDYRTRLEEKQKLRFNYGIGERQLVRYFRMAKKSKGDTGHNLLTYIESRLDNVLFRAGLAPTIPAARQLVNHGHVLVDGKKLDIPSATLKPGQKLTLRDKTRKLALVRDVLDEAGFTVPSFLEVDKDKLEVTFLRRPERDEVLLDVHENLIIEYYNRIV